ncbi:MAG: carbamoyl-phosphate synthase large subunit [Candidatus Omnitrophica bacterium]|nr:carbamoyl-phosphate synthase large subunit [Candidatus Omnitrophota bacterium]
MPKRTDIKSILIIGSGPIIIGQACEFDYSGTQACKALREEGYKIILVNSNPATIMTDPDMADRTYIEPITPQAVAKIIEKERPDAILPTLGGQTGLNTAVKLYEQGTLTKFNVEMLGANYTSIKKAEERDLFKKAMTSIGLDLPKSALAHTMEDAVKVARQIGFPVIIRPGFTLGGTGGGIAHSMAEFKKIASNGLKQSMISEILVEESLVGWKEYELEVMRDLKDNVVIICSIENFDPMGVHTGDSITVAPAQTLTDRCYQDMRDAAIKIIREIGVETGGSNIQFAVHPDTGRMVVIEMNPRVSRSSALASKATGFPIAKMAAKLAVGYTLDEIPNDITKETPAAFEPTIDYCVVKIPRFTFEKFPEADPTLGVQMKSVGETMAIGRTFKEALQKGLRGLEKGNIGLDNIEYELLKKDKIALENVLIEKLKKPNDQRIFYIKYAIEEGMPLDKIFKYTAIDPWFLFNMKQIVDAEKELYSTARKSDKRLRKSKAMYEFIRELKRYGFSDRQIADAYDTDEITVRKFRKAMGIEATFKLVDTCGAEFKAYTPYYYSTYEDECEVTVSTKRKIMILGGGPNRIGQGIEFDYCCCQASFALREMGIETIMVNSNPETVSTDYDTSDKLYFEPLTFEDIMNIVDRERPDGIIVQLGGQTPLNLARKLSKAGAPIIGTSIRSIDDAEDRERFQKLMQKLKIAQPPNGTAFSFNEARKVAREVGYPIVVRPSYVLGGRAMKIVYTEESLREYIKVATRVSPEHPILIDKFLENAIEVDVDCVSDGTETVVAGIMEHIEEAGVHSGDSACVLPPFTLGTRMIEEIVDASKRIAAELKVCGLMNIQWAIKNDVLFILEVNPRASRTVPFVSKATGVPLAKIATKVMAGKTLKQLGFTKPVIPEYISVKESVLPFSRFSGVDTILGPEMKSTGEVMGVDQNYGMAFAKSQLAAGQIIPSEGNVFVSVCDNDKREIIFIAKKLVELGFKVIATEGTARVLKVSNVEVTVIKKIAQGSPNTLTELQKGNIHLIINTPSGELQRKDEQLIRSAAVLLGIPYVTTMAGAMAACIGIESMKTGTFDVKPIQEYHKEVLKKK